MWRLRWGSRRRLRYGQRGVNVSMEEENINPIYARRQYNYSRLLKNMICCDRYFPDFRDMDKHKREIHNDTNVRNGA